MNKLILLIGFVAMTLNVCTQEKTMLLWPDHVPYAVENKLVEQKTISDWGSPIVSDITEPGLLIFRCKGEKPRPAIVICPGGGYAVEAYDHEGVKVAEWLNSIGVHAFVLKYRLPDERISSDPSFTPVTDAMQAINILHAKAEEWRIDGDAIGVMGFSAGGHLAASVSNLYHLKRFNKQGNKKPAFSILMYPVISMTDGLTHKGSKRNLLGKNMNGELEELFSCEKQVTVNTPPTFILHASDDKAVKVDNTHAYVDALKENHVPCRKVIFPEGGHGFGFRDGAETNKWTIELEQWLRNTKIIQ